MARDPHLYSAVHAVIFRKSENGLEVLLAQRQNTGYYDGFYAFPAGHVEKKERIVVAIGRESSEEIDETELKPCKVFFQACAAEIVGTDKVCPALVLQHNKDYGPEASEKERYREYIEVFFTLDGTGKEYRNAEPEKCDDLRFFPVSSLPKNMMPLAHYALERIMAGDWFDSFGYDEEEPPGRASETVPCEQPALKLHFTGP